jgi:hypothetical protein
LKKSALPVLMVIALFSQTLEAKRLWRTVPGFKYIFVDEASIHRQRPPLPPRDDHHLRPWDTTVDIKVDGQTYPDQQFWCVPRGKVQFGPLGADWLFTVWPPKTEPRKGRFQKTAMDAVEHVVCVDLEPSYLGAQTEAAVQVHVSAETCLVGNLDISCSDVGAKLRELGTPLDAQIHVIGDAHASYKATSAALQSLRSAGFKLKVGYINVQAH